MSELIDFYISFQRIGKMQTEDGEIVYKCLNGKPEAFGFLVDKYRESIFAFAYSELHNFHDAEDITQEVFIKAYRKLKCLRHYDRFIAWLYSITYHQCKNLIRSRQNRPDRDYVEDQTPEALMIPSMNSYREDIAIETINEALDSLPKLYSQALTLHYLGGMSIKEIAVFLGTSINAIKHRLSRARTQLKGEVLGMMSETFSQQKLRAGFTFRIVEAIKHIKIQSVPPIKTVPWILSLAVGVIFGVLGLGSGIKLPDLIPAPMSSSLVGETKVLEVGEIPVDVLKTSEMTFISNDMGKGKGGNPEQFNVQSIFMAPQGQADTWIKKADMHISRRYFSTNVVDRKIYAIGGGSNSGLVSTVEEYNPVTDKWTKKADILPRWYFSAGLVNGKIYIIGGEAEQDNVWVPVSTVEEYDPVKDICAKKADMPTVRRGLSVCALNGKIYAIGGNTAQAGITLQTVEEYDPATDKWTKKADIPTARNDLCTGAVNGRIYAIGGANRNVGVFSTVEEYDPVTDTWTRKADMLTARWGLSGSVVNGKIYAIGGCPPWADTFASIVEEYDPSEDKWTRKADMPTARRGLSTVAVNGKIYAIGGWNDQDILSIVEEYDTGFEGEGLEANGKLPTTWGSRKSNE